MVKRVQCKRWAILAKLVAVQALVVTAVLLTLPSPASAQWFDGGFGNFWGSPWGQQRRNYRSRRTYRNQNGYQSGRAAQPNVDYSKAPAPKKIEAQPQTNVLVVGDSLADWLAYGLEQSFAESPEMGVLRRHRTSSGLIQQEARRDANEEHPDWPKLLPEILAADKPDYIIMMIGLNDRRQIRDIRPPRATVIKPPEQQQQPGAESAQPPAAANAVTDPKKADAEAAAKKAAESEAAPARTTPYDFRSEKWVELYIKRIDQTIAAMKKAGVPVFWVGLPPVRGSRSTADFSFLNDLFRSRADKAGIVYVDIWDGFVEENGRFSYYGPDVEGQKRRLRTWDGIHFTEAGARKLAHFVERELQRSMTARPTPVALPVDDPSTVKAPETAEKPPGAPAGVARPLAGPVISLSGVRNSEDDDALAGSAKAKPEPAIVDAVATKVLVKGDPVQAPAGRADDFSWPRRDIAPVGSDPTVSVATLPMTPMKAERRLSAREEAPAEGTPGATPGAAGPGQQPAQPRVVRRQALRQSGGWFFGNWGWQQQQQQQQYQQQQYQQQQRYQQQRQYRQRAQQPGFFPFLFRR
ncbi:MAG: GDSL-type esterase/lipase family protein [Xanthobacteraceae bacterium]